MPVADRIDPQLDVDSSGGAGGAGATDGEIGAAGPIFTVIGGERAVLIENDAAADSVPPSTDGVVSFPFGGAPVQLDVLTVKKSHFHLTSGTASVFQ